MLIGIGNNIGGSIVAAGELGDLSTVLAGADFDFRASQYSSGQTWENAIAGKPSVTLGGSDVVGGDDPTFATDKFTFDGGDFFDCADFTGTIVEDWHKSTNTGWTFIVAGKFPSSGTTWFAGNTAGGGDKNGVYLFKDTGNRLQIQLVSTSGNVNYTSSANTITPAVEALLIVSVNPSTGGIRYWFNSATKTAASVSWTTNTGAATGEISFAGVDGGVVKTANGTEIRAFGLGSGFIDNEEAADIISYYEADTGLTYI